MKLKIKKTDIENLLNGFSGNYREIFIESSVKSTLRLVNGVVESPSTSEESGFSVLSRTGEEKFFKASSELKDIKKEVRTFAKTFDLTKQSDKVNLGGEESLMLKNRNLEKDIRKMSTYLDACKEILKNEDLIISYNIYFLLSEKNYIVGNTKGAFIQDSQYYNSFYIILTGNKGDIYEEVFEKITGTEILKEISKKNVVSSINKAIRKLKLSLNGLSSPSGVMDVIIGNEAGGTIIHEAVGHGLEADLMNSSVYKGKIGEKVASSGVNVVDNPTLKGKRGAYDFDHEGTKTEKTYLIKDGILISYLHNNATGELFDVKSTGHGRRESYKYTNLVRMGVTYLESGKDKKEDMIKSIKNGIYVSTMGSGQVNEVTGDFVFQITLGYEIKNGKLGKVIRGATLSGNGLEMLNNIEGIGDCLDFFDGGTCGKGQLMPVSDATPTIHVKLKVTGKN
ncbi:MAG: TldD/PmbA family protein [Candidatus Gracilibacteria bacterium]|nr:TldD/PmbA family protein [Candidatus Gracilibacteria bacterium]